MAASLGLEVVEIELRGGGKSRMLRIFIDKPGGVTHEDCERFSHDFGTLIDVEDLVPGSEYLLEVSSPGLDRKLTKPVDYERFRGSLVKLQTFQPVAGNRHWQGRLTAVTNGRITLDRSAIQAKGKAKKAAAGDALVEIELANIEKAHLVPEL